MQIRIVFSIYLICEMCCPSEVLESFVVSQDKGNAEYYRNRKAFFAVPYFFPRCYIRYRQLFVHIQIVKRVAQAKYKNHLQFHKMKGTQNVIKIGNYSLLGPISH